MVTAIALVMAITTAATECNDLKEDGGIWVHELLVKLAEDYQICNFHRSFLAREESRPGGIREESRSGDIFLRKGKQVIMKFYTGT